MTILCQLGARRVAGPAHVLDIFDIFDGFQIMSEMTILLGANVRSGSHWLPAHGASRTTGRNDGGGFGTQVPCLLPRHPACKRRVIFFRTIQIVSDDNDAVLVFVVAEFHAADPKLLSRLQIKFGKARRRREHRASIR